MAKITLTIPDEIVERVLDAFDGHYAGRPEDVTKAAWAKQQVRHYVRMTVRQWERQEASIGIAEAAEEAADEATKEIS